MGTSGATTQGKAYTRASPGCDTRLTIASAACCPQSFPAEIISEPASGDTYRNGETIEIVLEFDDPADVLGQPQIRPLIDGHGDPERRAIYSRGSGTDTFVFAYTVQITDVDYDGVALMKRDSGGFEPSTTRVYQAGTDNSLTGHIVGIEDAVGHQVDGRPSVIATTITSSPAQGNVYRPGETINISLSYEESVVVEGTPSIAGQVGGNPVALQQQQVVAVGQAVVPP